MCQAVKYASLEFKERSGIEIHVGAIYIYMMVLKTLEMTPNSHILRVPHPLFR